MGDLLADTNLTSQQEHYVSVCQLAGLSLLDIVDDILDSAKLEANGVTVASTPFDLAHTVQEILNIHRMVASAKG